MNAPKSRNKVERERLEEFANWNAHLPLADACDDKTQNDIITRTTDWPSPPTHPVSNHAQYPLL